MELYAVFTALILLFEFSVWVILAALAAVLIVPVVLFLVCGILAKSLRDWQGDRSYQRKLKRWEEIKCKNRQSTSTAPAPGSTDTM